MGEINGVANVEESPEQQPELDAPRGAVRGFDLAVFFGAGIVKPADGRRETLSLDETHRIERAAFGVAPQAINRNDARMLEIARDLRLEHKPGSLAFTLGKLGLNLLDGHVTLEFSVPCQPYLSDSSPRMLADQPEAARLAPGSHFGA